MLPAYIIEKIKQREKATNDQPQVTLELPIVTVLPRVEQAKEPAERGVVIIDLG